MAAEIKNGTVLVRAAIVLEVKLQDMVVLREDGARRRLRPRVPMTLFNEESREFLKVRVRITVLQSPVSGEATPFEGEIKSVSEMADVPLLGMRVSGTIHLVGPWDIRKPVGHLEIYRPETDA
jgi:hypothetical protein